MKREVAYEDIRGRVRESILERIDYSRETGDDQILEMIDEDKNYEMKEIKIAKDDILRF